LNRSSRIQGAIYIAAGALHFARPRVYEAIMPRWLPAHRELVLASGAAEVLGGAALLGSERDGIRMFARWWMLATLAGVYPANVDMALHPERYPRIPPWALWARLPLQAVMMLGVWRATAPEAARSA
jgi:uncharacterized membrane protein